MYYVSVELKDGGCVKHACMALHDNPDQVSISDVLSIFNEYEDVLHGKDSSYPIRNED